MLCRVEVKSEQMSLESFVVDSARPGACGLTSVWR